MKKKKIYVVFYSLIVYFQHSRTIATNKNKKNKKTNKIKN